MTSLREEIPNKYYYKKFSKIFDNVIMNTWENEVKKPFDNDCIHTEYVGARNFLLKLKEILK